MKDNFSRDQEPEQDWAAGEEAAFELLEMLSGVERGTMSGVDYCCYLDDEGFANRAEILDMLKTAATYHQVGPLRRLYIESILNS